MSFPNDIASNPVIPQVRGAHNTARRSSKTTPASQPMVSTVATRTFDAQSAMVPVTAPLIGSVTPSSPLVPSLVISTTSQRKATSFNQTPQPLTRPQQGHSAPTTFNPVNDHGHSENRLPKPTFNPVDLPEAPVVPKHSSSIHNSKRSSSPVRDIQPVYIAPTRTRQTYGYQSPQRARGATGVMPSILEVNNHGHADSRPQVYRTVRYGRVSSCTSLTTIFFAALGLLALILLACRL